MNNAALQAIAELSIKRAQQRFSVASALTEWDPATMSHQLDAWSYDAAPAPAVPVLSLQGVDAVALAESAAAFEPDAISLATNVTRGTGEDKTISRMVMTAGRDGIMVLAEFDLLEGGQMGPARYVARSAKEYTDFLDKSMGKVIRAAFFGSPKSAQQTVRNVTDDSVRWLIYGSTSPARKAVELALSLGWTGVEQSSDLCAINAAPSKADAETSGRKLAEYNQGFALDALISSLSVLTTDSEFEHQRAQRAAGRELARA